MGKVQELRPCPHCSGSAVAHEIINMVGSRYHAVTCSGCNARTGLFKSTAEAIAAWNRRSSDEQAEVVGHQWRYRTDPPDAQWRTPSPADLEYVSSLPDKYEVRALYSSPPAVAAGGVTEAVLDKAFRDFIRGRDAAIDARPQVVDLNQVVRAGLGYGVEAVKHDNDNLKPRRPIGGQACTNEDFVPHNKVYVAAGSYDVKIGTSKDVYRRFGEIRRETCDDIDIVGIFLGNEYLERRLHRHFVEYNYGSGTEWFRREGRLAEWIDAGCPDELTVSLYYERSSRSA